MLTFEPLDGALLVDKPKGPTSHDIVDAIRRQFRIGKVGHAGTLDPNATGLLIILLGRGTRLSEKMMSDDKIYTGTARFGEATDSYDADGKVTSTHPVPPLTAESINDVAATFVGDQMQTPPMVSAVKMGGVPLYKLARKGVEVERKARLIHIYDYSFSGYEEPLGWFRVACTKGTYVRSLVHELGGKLGCGAYLLHLRRESSGPFNAKDAVLFEDAMNFSRTELESHVLPFLKLTGGPA